MGVSGPGEEVGAAVGIPIEKSIRLDPADVEFKDFVDLLFEWGGRIYHAELPD